MSTSEEVDVRLGGGSSLLLALVAREASKHCPYCGDSDWVGDDAASRSDEVREDGWRWLLRDKSFVGRFCLQLVTKVNWTGCQRCVSGPLTSGGKSRYDSSDIFHFIHHSARHMLPLLYWFQ